MMSGVISSIVLMLYNTPFSEISRELVKFLLNTPSLLVTICLAFLSGHHWIYIILTYVSKKERKILSSRTGKICIGLLWFILISVPISLILYRSIRFSLERLISISVTCAIYSLWLQAIIFITINLFERKRTQKG